MKKLNQRLETFFTTNFHQNWGMYGARDWRGVIDEYIFRSDPDGIYKMLVDLREYLQRAVRGSSVPAEFTRFYDPSADGLDDTAWIKAIADYIEVRLTSG